MSKPARRTIKKRIRAVEGVFDVFVREEERLFAKWPRPLETYLELVVDLRLRSGFEANPPPYCVDDLNIIKQVEEILRDLVPVGVPVRIKQRDELMGKDGELPTFSELAVKVPDLQKQVGELMDHLDLWTVRSMQVKKDKDGRVESIWVPGLAPDAAKPRDLENLTVMLLEFVVPSRNAERFTTLARSITGMTSKLGREGSLTGTLEETVRKTMVENEDLRWAAAQYRQLATEAMNLAYDYRLDELNDIGPLQAIGKKLADQDMNNVGAVFAKRFVAMEQAVNAKRPEVAAELIRGLDDDAEG